MKEQQHSNSLPRSKITPIFSGEPAQQDDGANLGAEVAGPDPVCEDDPYPRYPEGDYQARCVAVKIYRDPRFRTWKAALKFQILWSETSSGPGELTGEPVYAFFHMGTGDKPHAGRGSRYRQAWVIANGSQPTKRQVLSKRVFIGKIFLVRIGDTTKRSDGTAHHPAEVYSTVKEIRERKWP